MSNEDLKIAELELRKAKIEGVAFLLSIVMFFCAPAMALAGVNMIAGSDVVDVTWQTYGGSLLVLAAAKLI